MATLTADIIPIVKELVNEVREKRDIYATIFISYNGVSVSIYPNDEESEVI